MTDTATEVVDEQDVECVFPVVTYEVGQVLHEREDFSRVPVNTVIEYSGQHYRKTDTNEWYYISREGALGMRYGRNTDFSLGINRITSLPEPEVSGPGVGDRVLTRGTLNALPRGTVLGSPAGNRYTIQGDGMYLNQRTSNIHPLSRLRIRSVALTIESMPAVLTVEGDDNEVRPPVETLAMFKQRFRTVTMGSAQASGVSREPLLAAFRKLGVEDHGPGLGLVVCQSDIEFMAQMPASTVLQYGDDPTAFHGYGVFRYSGRDGLVRLLGGAVTNGTNLMKIVQGEGLERPGWLDEEAEFTRCEQDIRQFKRAAWELGVQAKRDNQWCGEYEAAMRRCGIDASIMNEPAVQVTAAEAADLPVGTILRYGNDLSSAVFVRDDSSNNPARTVRLFGTMPGAWAREMEVLFNPSNGTHLRRHARVLSAAEMDASPERTTVVDGENEAANGWTKIDGMWRAGGETGYGYSSGNFSFENLRYFEFGPVTAQ